MTFHFTSSSALRLLLAFATLVVLSGCSEKTYRWDEEMVLSSGERLMLDRLVRVERISAPFNPFKTGWAWRESTIVVKDGPADLKGIRYEARLLPLLIERDPTTRPLIAVGIPVTCDVAESFKLRQGELYVAFELGIDLPMRQVPIPEFAWERRTNLLQLNHDEAPSRNVTPDYVDQFNRTQSRGARGYFQILRSNPHTC